MYLKSDQDKHQNYRTYGVGPYLVMYTGDEFDWDVDAESVKAQEWTVNGDSRTSSFI